MGAVNLSAIATALGQIFEDQIVSQINRATVLLQVLPTGYGTSGNIKWVARMGTAVGKTIADGDDVPDGDLTPDSRVPATLDYGTYHEPFAVTGKALAAAAATGNPSDLRNLFAEELGDAIERLTKKLSQDLYTGAGTSEAMLGLYATAGALRATGQYAAIDRSTYPQWAATEMLNGGVARALTIDLMREMRRRIYIASGKKPDLIVGEPILHEKYGKLIGQQRRYVQEVTIRGQKIVLDGGYQMLEFDGIPFLEDVDAPSGKLGFLNTRFTRVLQLPDGVSAVNQSMAMVGITGTDEEQLGMPQAKLTARINPLGRKGDKYEFQLILYPQLQNKRPNAGGWIGDLNGAL
jgi:hypothetical protein